MWWCVHVCTCVLLITLYFNCGELNIIVDFIFLARNCSQRKALLLDNITGKGVQTEAVKALLVQEVSLYSLAVYACVIYIFALFQCLVQFQCVNDETKGIKKRLTRAIFTSHYYSL